LDLASTRTARQLTLIRELSRLMGDANIRFWLRGGWALDFLLGASRADTTTSIYSCGLRTRTKLRTCS
jgi:hypothetical protein